MFKRAMITPARPKRLSHPPPDLTKISSLPQDALPTVARPHEAHGAMNKARHVLPELPRQLWSFSLAQP